MTPRATALPSFRPQGCKSALTSAFLWPHLVCNALNRQLLAPRQLFKPHLSGQAFALPNFAKELLASRARDTNIQRRFLDFRADWVAKEQRTWNGLECQSCSWRLSDAQRTASPDEVGRSATSISKIGNNILIYIYIHIYKQAVLMIYLPPYVNLLDWSQLDILLDCPWFAHSVLCDLHYVLPLPHHLGLAMHKEMRAPDGQAYRAEFACLFPWETGCHHFCFAALQHLSLSLPRSLSLSPSMGVLRCPARPKTKWSGTPAWQEFKQ